MSRECIFCRIVAGELPCTKLYEDDDVLVFMDIGPVVKGHALVIPKQHVDPVTAVPDDILQKVIVVAKRVAQAMYDGLDADGVNIAQANGRVAGQVVPHVHFHVIPRFASDGHSFNWTPLTYERNGEMDALADRLRSAEPLQG